MTRDIVTEGQIQQAIEEVVLTLNKRLKKKGYGAFTSLLEVYGKLCEENYEILLEVHAKNEERFKAELIDICVVGIFGLASLAANKKL